MSKTPGADYPRITPFYETDWPNHPITLATENASLISNTTRNEEGKEFVADGIIKVTMHWSPVRFNFEFDGEILQGDSADDKFKHLDFSCLGDDVRIEAETFQALGLITADGNDGVDGVIEQNEISCGTDHKLESVIFHLANYSEISSSRIVRDREPGGFGAVRDYSEIELQADGWRILLHPHRWSRELNWDAEKDVGNILNGVGKITRANDEEFTISSVRKVIDSLDAFLSFVFFQRMPLMLCVGSNSTESKSWQLWRTKNVQWVFGHNLKTWVPIGGGDQLSTAFAGFYQKWNAPDWHEPLKLAIEWLLNADIQTEEGNMHGAIAFAQIPFEMLASAASVGGSNAADQIQRLLVNCHVPFETPPDLENLYQLERNTKFDTGPKLITRVRNTIIHPDEKNRKQLTDWEKQHGVSAAAIQGETYRLFQHYMVLILLHLIGYQGTYRKRLGWKNLENILSDLLGHQTPWSTEEGV